MSADTILTFRNVNFGYGPHKVLDDVSFTVKRGEYVGIVGPNGGGKTTLFKLVLGILKPHSGEIKLFGKEPEETRYRVGYVPQYFNVDRQFPINVAALIEAGLLNHSGFLPNSKKEAKEKIANVLKSVYLDGYQKRAVGELSGGELQRVLIARALVSDPELLLLDEPTANVDPAVGVSLNGLFQELNKDHTIVIVSHDIGFVSSSVTSILCLNEKLYQHDGSKLTPEVIESLYGGHVHLVNHCHHCHGEENDAD